MAGALVTAAVARATAAQFADMCRFRFQLHDEHGRLLTEGPLPRPTTKAPAVTA